MYATTGNGTFDLTPFTPTATDVGDSAIKLAVGYGTGGLTPYDYYTPPDLTSYPQLPGKTGGNGLCPNDVDFGSGGVLIFPENFYTDLNHQTAPNLAVTGDKQSNLYVLNRDLMGHYSSSGGNAFQLKPIRYATQFNPQGQGFWSTPAYWKFSDASGAHYQLYVSVTNDNSGQQPPVPTPFPIDMYKLATSGTTGPIGSQPDASTPLVFCKFSPTPVISSNGTSPTTGIVWGVERQVADNPTDCNGATKPAALHAFDATTMLVLYNSRALTLLSNAQSFTTPTVFQTRVYVATGSGATTQVNVFGICSTFGGCQN
ncbi:MAG: hypothetical protein ACRD3L_18230 [Terriglobales bacterium]